MGRKIIFIFYAFAEKKYISNKRAVTKLQSLLFQCLYILIKKNHYGKVPSYLSYLLLYV